jgi:ABC-2 type transport system permease protein
MILRDLAQSRELLRNLVLRDLRGRYKRSVLGIVWSLINPLASLIIYAAVFRYIVAATPEPGDPSGLDSFALWLLCGLLPWSFFSVGTSAGLRTVVDNAGLVRKVWFPREVLVFGSLGAQQVTFCIELGLLSVALLIAGNMVLPWLPVLVLVLALLFVFTVGVTLTLAALFVSFRDLSHLWGVVMQAGFYAVPIIYPISLLPDGLDEVVRWNPMTVFVGAIRNLLYDLRMPPWSHLGYLAAWAAAMFVLGAWVFARRAPRFAEDI